MVPMPVTPGDGGDDPVPGLPQGLRLSDAEEIAARRFDDVEEGSLGEALAVTSTADATDAGSQHTEALGVVGEGFASGSLIRLIDARLAEADRTPIGEPHFVFSPMARPPVLDVGIALVTPVADSVAPPVFAAPEVAGEDEPALKPSEDAQSAVADTLPAPATAPLPDATAAQSIEPLTSALDAAVRLAADANVAAEALENLKRLLEHKQQMENQLQHVAAGSNPGPATDNASASAPAPPLPLPLHAEQDAAGAPTARPAVLPPPPRQRPRAPPERRGFDLRGFMAGFALSWAFGVVLYLFMTAG
jgi:hypothetical protein